MSVETRAIELAKQYFVENGYEVEDVSHKPGHNGYDFRIVKDGIAETAEIKGCSREWQIPNLFSPGFDANKKLIANYLCVVYLIESSEPSICIIPRDAIPPEYVVPRMGYRIKSQLKKKCALEKYSHSLTLREELDS